MRHYIITAFILVALSSCQEDEPIPKVDVLLGSYYLSAPEAPVEISFNITKEWGAYNYTGSYVNHAAIPEDQRRNNIMHTFDKFENGNGYGRIEITSRGAFYYKVILIYNRFTTEGLMAYDVQIDIPSEPFIVLNDQVFNRLEPLP